MTTMCPALTEAHHPSGASATSRGRGLHSLPKAQSLMGGVVQPLVLSKLSTGDHLSEWCARVEIRWWLRCSHQRAIVPSGDEVVGDCIRWRHDGGRFWGRLGGGGRSSRWAVRPVKHHAHLLPGEPSRLL